MSSTRRDYWRQRYRDQQARLKVVRQANGTGVYHHYRCRTDVGEEEDDYWGRVSEMGESLWKALLEKQYGSFFPLIYEDSDEALADVGSSFMPPRALRHMMALRSSWRF